MSSRKPLSVAVTYPAWMLALVLGVALLLGGLGIRGTQSVTDDLLERLLGQATERLRLAVASTLETPQRLSELNADFVERGAWPVDTPADLRALVPNLRAQLNNFDSISAVLICNAARDTVWVERMGGAGAKLAVYDSAGDGKCREWLLDEHNRTSPEPIGAYDYDPQGRPWYQAAFDQADGWSSLYVWAGTEEPQSVGCGHAVLIRDNDGAVKAIIDVGFTVDELSDELTRLELSPNARVFIVDTEGQLVASDSHLAPASVDGATVRAVVSQDPIVAAAARIAADSSGGDGLHNGGFIDASEMRWEVESTLLDLPWAPTWTIVLAIPDSDLVAGVDVVEQRLLISSIVVLLLAACAGFGLARSIARPILQLRLSAARLADGDFDTHFESHGGAEFKALGADLEAMKTGLRERLAMRSALEVAMEVQQHLLPASPPDSSTLDIAGLSIYSDETGGDYFDYPDASHLIDNADDGGTLIAIGDVTGHGIGAALIMATARSALRTRLRSGGDLGALLRDVNEALVGDVPAGRFMTLLTMLISGDGEHVRWAGAGHDPPILFDPASAAFTEPDGGGIPLGIMAEQTYEEYDLPFGGIGSILVSATDGVWETASPSGELFGKERLKVVIREHQGKSADGLIQAIIVVLDEFRESDRPLDDVTIVVVKRRA